ncbi:hypothetical protein GP486_001170 [Trichoglossum hirsutum]|uniref:CCCH zinc finger and RRM domain-containing protein n=1 Tax=Trichoglossum hirsutum TaxID=265104 RepID=A0A9P8LHD0_9PEZI|nr:hypothetical protein GP486_001170 [Trichoglossum hirsutum]
MLFDEDDTGPLKKWIVRRLEDISDADSDVLADYVLALLRHDQPVEEVRKLCIDQLDDFLKDHTTTFVNDIFGTIASKSYLPSNSASSACSPTTPSIFSPPTGPAATLLASSSNSTNAGPLGRDQSRKRSYHDREGSEPWDGKDPHYGRTSSGDRAFKQPRRGNARSGRLDGFGNRGARPGPQQLPVLDAAMTNLPGMPQQPSIGFPGMPQPPPGFFDPNDPMAAFIAMQTMGFPLPAMPFPPAGSPSGFVPTGGQQSPILDAVPPVKRIGERCRDYDEKGFCALGSTCPYEHGTNPIVVPGDGDGESTFQAGLGDNLTWRQEYDPNNSALVTDIKKPNTNDHGINGSGKRDSNRGSDRGGRGRSRGGSNTPATRRGGRAEFSHAGPNQDRSITTVVVESIPEDKFQEETVREFFSAFGNIQDIQMQSYKRLALVKYADWASAKRAYDSPKVIFDNRFVKVYWYKPESVPKPPVAANGTARAGSPTPSKKANDGEMEIDMEDFKKKQEEAQKAHEEKLRKKKETEDAKKELEKRREELLKNQAEEKRKLMERLTARSTSGEKATSSSPSAPSTPQIENDTNGATMNGGVEGKHTKTSSQTEALRAQLAALEAEARSLGIDSTLSEDGWSTRGRGRGRGTFRGRGNYAPRGHETFRGGYRGRGGFLFAARGRGGAMKLDNRTKKVAVSGTLFDSNKDESLRQYLLFIHGGSEIPGVGKVELSWVNTPLPPVAVNKQPPHEAFTSVSAPTTNDGDTAMVDGDIHKAAEDYDVAEDDDDRWMAQ